MDLRAQLAERWRWIIAGIGCLVALWLTYPYYQEYMVIFYDPDAVRTFIESFGIWAPVALIGLQIFQVLLAPIPGQVVGIASGYAFGAFWGTIYTMIGVSIGSIIAILGAKRYGRPLVERFVSDEQLEQFDALTETYGFTPFFLLFLLPGFPDDTVCFIAGLTPMSANLMIVYAIIGRLPGMLALNMTGNSLALMNLDMTILLVFVIAAVSGLSIHQRDRILSYAEERKQKDAN